MAFPWIKSIHLLAVLCSGILFFSRGVMEFSGIHWRRWKILRWLPHAIDSVLLLSAVILVVLIKQYPLVHAWLTAKVLALIVYIVLGSLALKPGRSPSLRLLCFIAALICFIYIVGAARMHHWASWLLPYL